MWSVARADKLTLQPAIKESRNSQTMALLEGHLNVNPIATGGPILAVVDEKALESVGEDGSTFVDQGASGHGEISVYTVRKGDTLSGIAQMFGVSSNTILWANDLKSGNTLREGQELVILPISGVRHTVKSGDTLKSIATKYKADLNDIIAYNDLTADAKLKTGDVILVPDGELSASQTPAKTSVGGTNVASGYFIRPLSGGRKSQGIHGHNGVDIAAPIGTPLVASAGGKVIIAKSSGYNGGYGSYVAISHPNGTQTVYGHMSRVDVAVGQTVSQGQTIGAVGNTGNSTGPHVHFEIRGAKNPF